MADPTILRRKGGAPAVATLTSLDGAHGGLIVELGAGRNLVGRTHGHFGHWPERAYVESTQWVIECDEAETRVADAGTTNGCVRIPSGMALDGRARLDLLLRPPAGAEPLPHPNQPGGGFELRYSRLSDGDRLLCFYATFIFHR